MPYDITQCYLAPGRGDFPAFTPAEAGTRFSDPGGMRGWVDLTQLSSLSSKQAKSVRDLNVTAISPQLKTSSCTSTCHWRRCVDYVRLYLDLESPAVNERHRWNYELCDDRLTTTALDKYYSSTSFLIMAFHTDKFAANRTGFRAFYRFIDKRKCVVPRQSLKKNNQENIRVSDVIRRRKIDQLQLQAPSYYNWQWPWQPVSHFIFIISSKYTNHHGFSVLLPRNFSSYHSYPLTSVGAPSAIALLQHGI